MKEKKELILIKDNNEEKIYYETTSAKKATILSLIIQTIFILCFEWWIWLPALIFTSKYSFNKYEDVANNKRKVDLLINNDFIAKDIKDAKLLKIDFNIPNSLIKGYEISESISSKELVIVKKK